MKTQTARPVAGPVGTPSPGRLLPVVGGVVFLVAYLAVSPLSGAVSSDALPLPDAPRAEVLDYYATNGAASVVTAVCQLVSACGLVAFCLALLRRGHGDRLRTTAAAVAVASIVVSSALAIVIGVGGTSLADDLLLGLRSASFYTGGVVHVVALGVLVGACVFRGEREAFDTKPVRRLGRFASVVACLSTLSVAVYVANAFLPLGRLSVMVWTVVVGVSLARRGLPGTSLRAR